MNETALINILEGQQGLIKTIASYAPDSLRSTVKRQSERIQAGINTLKRTKGKDFSGDSKEREQLGMFQSKGGR